MPLDYGTKHLEEAHAGPITVELGFDAVKGLHDYEILVTAEAAQFWIDGATVGQFGAKDLPGGVWRTGLMKAFANL